MIWDEWGEGVGRLSKIGPNSVTYFMDGALERVDGIANKISNQVNESITKR
jgi:hypothetical protein